MPHFCNIYAIPMQYPCTIHAKSVQCLRNTQARYIEYQCNIDAIVMRDPSICMQYLCNVNARSMQYMCNINATCMHHLSNIHAISM